MFCFFKPFHLFASSWSHRIHIYVECYSQPVAIDIHKCKKLTRIHTTHTWARSSCVLIFHMNNFQWRLMSLCIEFNKFIQNRCSFGSFCCIRFFAMCVRIWVRAVQLYRKKVSKIRAEQRVFSFIFGLRMASRGVTRHSTAGSETLLLCSLFLMLPQYDDDGGAINSLLSPLLLSLCVSISIPLISFIRLFARSIAFSFYLRSLCVCALAKRANSTACTLSSTFLKVQMEKNGKPESMKEMTRKRARKRTDKRNNEQIFSCCCCCVVTFLRALTHTEREKISSCAVLIHVDGVRFFIVCLLCRTFRFLHSLMLCILSVFLCLSGPSESYFCCSVRSATYIICMRTILRNHVCVFGAAQLIGSRYVFILVIYGCGSASSVPHLNF